MACGRPVVASAVDGLAEVVGTAGLLVPAEDAEALASALQVVCGDPDRWARLRAAGVERARRFDIQRTADAYDQLYARLLTRR
jgi:glycosyltransferase involved in cell wall biosynthesis